MKLQFAALCAVLYLSPALKAQTLVFSDDFSSSTITEDKNPYVGGWFSPQLAFQQWTSTEEGSISSGGLNVYSTSATRSAGIVLSPLLFDGAGDYVLTFDLTDYTGDSNDTAFATVWAGSGYDLSNTSGNAITVDTYTASLLKSGSAETRELAATTLNTVSNGNQLGFSYDGSSAVALFLGVRTRGYPFPNGTFDNVSISKGPIDSVPEPNAAMLLGLAGTCILLVRRRIS